MCVALVRAGVCDTDVTESLAFKISSGELQTVLACRTLLQLITYKTSDGLQSRNSNLFLICKN